MGELWVDIDHLLVLIQSLNESHQFHEILQTVGLLLDHLAIFIASD